MELKSIFRLRTKSKVLLLLIELYGIEMLVNYSNLSQCKLLIELYGIEIFLDSPFAHFLAELLIELYGIEMFVGRV